MSGNRYNKLDTKHIVEGRSDEVMHNLAVYGNNDSSNPTFLRYVVLDAINDPAIIDATKLSYWEHELGVSNIAQAAVAPRNSIIARRVLGAGSSASEKVMVLYPFFPSHISLPTKPGEHVWVMFENPDASSSDIGYWMCRIVQPGFVDDVNYTHADRQFDPSFIPNLSKKFDGSDEPIYEFRNGAVDTKSGNRYGIANTLSIPDKDPDRAYQKLLTDTDSSRIVKYEPVPRYRKRPGDIAFEGSNNTLIVLGTDRVGPVADYDITPDRGKRPKPHSSDVADLGSGAIDIVTGRGQTGATSGKKVRNSLERSELGKSTKELEEKEGDVDLKNDRSRILVSQRTKPDKNFNIGAVVKKHSSEKIDDDSGSGSIVIKTDKVRLIARQDVVILVTGSSEKDADGNVKDLDATPENCASIIIKTNGDIVFTPSEKGVIRLGGDDATLSPLCTRVGRTAGMPGPLPPAPAIVDTMGGAQGLADGLNGTFPTRVLMK